MYSKDQSALRSKLISNGVTTENVEFIMSKITDSELDEDFKIVSEDTHRLMIRMGLWEPFEKSCQDLGIVLTRRNEPER